LLLDAVVVSLLGLIPAKTATALGVALLATSVVFGAVICWLFTRTAPLSREYERAGLHLAYTLPGDASRR
jgi:hypothetical protein